MNDKQEKPAKVDGDAVGRGECVEHQAKEGSKYIVWVALMVGAICVVVGFMINSALSTNKENYQTENGRLEMDMTNVDQVITTTVSVKGKADQIIEARIDGYSIFQENPTAEDLKKITSNHADIKNHINTSSKTDGSVYNVEYVEVYNPQLGYDELKKITFTKSLNDDVVWRVDIPNISPVKYIEGKNSIIVFGSTPTNSSLDKDYGRIAMISKDGKLLWDKTTSNGFNNEDIWAVISTENATIAFSRGDSRTLCLTKFDIDGNVVDVSKFTVGNYGIRDAIELDDGYLVRLSGVSGTKLVKIKADGIQEKSFIFSSEQNEYFITDMIAYNSNIYFSVDTVPKLDANESDAGSRFPLSRVLNEIHRRGDLDIPNEELTNLMRQNYTAMLLVYNPSIGKVKTFYTVKGSFAANLSIDDTGNLMWNVESIVNSFYSLAASSFQIGGGSLVFEYAFNREAELIGKEKTGEYVSYRR